eukprot:Rhum_TRINITY_DN20984_c0_g1::Rhum_TRINITY_DN20984_c0_g1_i1::g.172772::m.172772
MDSSWVRGKSAPITEEEQRTCRDGTKERRAASATAHREEGGAQGGAEAGEANLILLRANEENGDVQERGNLPCQRDHHVAVRKQHNNEELAQHQILPRSPRLLAHRRPNVNVREEDVAAQTQQHRKGLAERVVLVVRQVRHHHRHDQLAHQQTQHPQEGTRVPLHDARRREVCPRSRHSHHGDEGDAARGSDAVHAGLDLRGRVRAGTLLHVAHGRRHVHQVGDRCEERQRAQHADEHVVALHTQAGVARPPRGADEGGPEVEQHAEQHALVRPVDDGQVERADVVLLPRRGEEDQGRRRPQQQALRARADLEHRGDVQHAERSVEGVAAVVDEEAERRRETELARLLAVQCVEQPVHDHRERVEPPHPRRRLLGEGGAVVGGGAVRGDHEGQRRQGDDVGVQPGRDVAGLDEVVQGGAHQVLVQEGRVAAVVLVVRQVLDALVGQVPEEVRALRAALQRHVRQLRGGVRGFDARPLRRWGDHFFCGGRPEGSFFLFLFDDTWRVRLQ